MMKILIADDSPIKPTGLPRLVQKMGNAEIQAGDGAKAVELYERASLRSSCGARTAFTQLCSPAPSAAGF